MKKILIVALLPFALYSCEKDEDTNPKFRDVTCADTTDDGKFEEYTLPESTEFLRFYDTVPDAPDPNFLTYVKMSSRILYNNTIIYDPVFTYRQTKKSNLIIYLPTGGPEKYFSWVQNSTVTDTTVNVAIYNARRIGLPEGCHRLYYVFADTTWGRVLDKGHFDIEVRK